MCLCKAVNRGESIVTIIHNISVTVWRTDLVKCCVYIQVKSIVINIHTGYTSIHVKWGDNHALWHMEISMGFFWSLFYRYVLSTAVLSVLKTALVPQKHYSDAYRTACSQCLMQSSWSKERSKHYRYLITLLIMWNWKFGSWWWTLIRDREKCVSSSTWPTKHMCCCVVHIML